MIDALNKSGINLTTKKDHVRFERSAAQQAMGNLKLLDHLEGYLRVAVWLDFTVKVQMGIEFGEPDL